MKAKYIKNKGIRCPYCESEKIFAEEEINPNSVEKSILRVPVHCWNCGKEWYDIYKFQNIELVEK